MRKSLFGKFSSPYMDDSQSTIDDCYLTYQHDPYRKIEIGGFIYTRIISHCRFYGYEDYSYHIIWEPHTEIRRNDVLIDEKGNRFRVRSFEMIRFLGEIPEWYLKALPIVITGDCWDIGNYLTKAGD